MHEIKFHQTHRPLRHFLWPIVIAFVVLAAVGIGIYVRSPHAPAKVSVTHVAAVPTTITYSNDVGTLKLLGKTDSNENTLYVLAMVKVHNNLDTPVFLKDLTGALAMPDGSELLTSAVEKDDVAATFIAFPKVKDAAAGKPMLLRETEVPAKSDKEGLVLLGFRDATQQTWDQSKHAAVKIAPYHYDPIVAELK